MEGITMHHKAVSLVTNKTQPRLSMAMFYGPNRDTVNGPMEGLIDEEHPALHRSYEYAEFFEEFYRQEGTRRFSIFNGEND